MRSWIGSLWLRCFGWTVEMPDRLPKQFVFIAAPHTSNWDLVYMIAAAWKLRIGISWLGKHTLFRKPGLGPMLRAMGGLAVERGAPKDTVARIASLFRRSPDLILAIAPEGTRSKVEYWRSGFYHIARSANVPIGLGFLDYRRKHAGIGSILDPTDDLHADMERIRAFYRDIQGRDPRRQGPPLLREERSTPIPSVG